MTIYLNFNAHASSSEQEMKNESMPSSRKIFDYVQDLTDFGPRRSGSEAAVSTTEYISEKFREFGLHDVTIQKGDTLQWNATKWGLTFDGVSIPAFYMRYSAHSGNVSNFSTGKNGLESNFIYVGNSKDLKDFDVRGKIVVADVELSEVDFDGLKSVSSFVHDPGQTLNSEGHVDPFTPNNYPYNIVSASKNGAVGFIGILSNYIDSNRYYNEDVAYMVDDNVYFDIPGLWVAQKDGDVLKRMIEDNPKALGKLVLEGNAETVEYRTVVGHLPGKSSEILMVQSHHDSGFMGAVEDASGSAEVLALAEYYSQQPASSRERSMMFVTMDTHFTDYKAHEDLAENYILKGGRDVVANVTVEHIANEMVVKDGKSVMTGQVDPRLFITSPSLEELTRKKIIEHDYRRSMVVSTDLFSSYDDGIPTDVGVIQNIVGMPVVSLISVPVYLYDISDTVDKVALEELKPTAVLLSDIIDRLHLMPRDELSGNK